MASESGPETILPLSIIGKLSSFVINTWMIFVVMLIPTPPHYLLIPLPFSPFVEVVSCTYTFTCGTC